MVRRPGGTKTFSPDGSRGVILYFPGCTPPAFTPRMRGRLFQIEMATPGIGPITFETDVRGGEICRLTNGIVIGWNGPRACVTDTCSSFVDDGPFASFDEVCSVVASVCA